MFCPECRVKLRERAASRSKCGAFTVFSIAASVALLVLIITSVVLYLRSDAYQCKKKVKLEKLEDEESINMLNDKVVEVYLSEADSYCQNGDYQRAIDSYKEGWRLRKVVDC